MHTQSSGFPAATADDQASGSHLFWRRVSILVSGTALLQVLPLAVSPLLTRMYSPEDFGIFGLFMAVVGFTSAISCGRYELAIVISGEDDPAARLTIVSLALCTLFSALLAFVVATLWFFSPELSMVDTLGGWIWLIPGTTWLAGVGTALTYYQIHYDRYGTVSQANAIRGLTLSVTQVILGSITRGPLGLIIGSISAFVALVARLAPASLARLKAARSDRHQLHYAARRYSGFPKLNVPSIGVNTGTTLFIAATVSAIFSAATLGMYTLVQRIMGAPASIAGTSVGQVFMKAGTVDLRDRGSLRSLYDATVVRMFLVASPIFLMAATLSPWVFPTVFGQDWSLAGQIAVALSPMFWAQFISTPISNTANIYERQVVSLSWQVARLVVVGVVTSIGLLTSLTIVSFLWVLSLSLTCYYLGMIISFRYLRPRSS